jgi:hypothetical protein
MSWNKLNDLLGNGGQEEHRLTPKELYDKAMEGDPNASIAKNARVMKINSEPEDRNPNLSMGTVIGSLIAPHGEEAYLVIFDEQSPPGIAFVVGKKLQYMGMAESHGVHKSGGKPDNSTELFRMVADEELRQRIHQASGMDGINETIMLVAHQRGMALPPEESTIFIHKEGDYIVLYLQND